MLIPNVAPGIHCVTESHTNFFLVEDEGRLLLVDAGLPTSWRVLEAALSELGRRLGDIEALVLTHGHFDHLGIAERVRAELGVPVYIHENDVPLTRHPRQYGRARPLIAYLLTQVQALPVVAGLLARRAWWPKPVRKVERIRTEVLPVPGSPRVLFTPGHTLGHCALHFPDRDAVIAGDAVVTFDPYRAATGPRIVSGAATVDEERALESLDLIARTGARTVLVGHGPAWTEGAEKMVELARRRGPS
ncbi:MBL fold metallo-hydrolase [Amycolatopsis regifaucium]|uniref:MBL fold metallo-hydrolase n=1 Tax=Amycolatopsis regifaucium TaxID=546365 RepID=A0A154MK16_9PSEU|nr:MBL fold metallo-hydrolase [Amycolatopsis regifaucium]KZB83759.1 Zn-dependent hydrolase [Amycolatopsis regifaucium]OKA06801.1 MBL fold metallo-hydrolase [Amycolatopsis regifaucium]SFH27013.1 Glyoxylase, beta-lactamase superfamily II [Amycolatopsis regifaucium]